MNNAKSLLVFFFLVTTSFGSAASASDWCGKEFGCVEISSTQADDVMEVEELSLTNELNPSTITSMNQVRLLQKNLRAAMFAEEERQRACGVEYAYVCNGSTTEKLRAVLERNYAGFIVGQANWLNSTEWQIHSTRPLTYFDKIKVVEDMMRLTNKSRWSLERIRQKWSWESMY